MKSIRSKLVLSLLFITLLPVFPLYFLVQTLVQQSLEVGYNEKVALALDHASGFARELIALYKQQTLTFVVELAKNPEILTATSGRKSLVNLIERSPSAPGGFLITLIDPAGNTIYAEDLVRDDETMPSQIFDATSQHLAERNQPALLEVGGAGSIVAFAPVTRNSSRAGSLVLSRQLKQDFVDGSKRIVEVNQMFKTLDFFEPELRSGFLLYFFVIYAPVALLSVALGIYFSRKLTSPLVTLAEGTQRVAAGEWDYRMAVRSRDEVGDLVDAFNTMLSAIKEKQAQVIALEKMAVWREMARVLAHEIKNPLTPIQLTVQQMKDKYSGDDADYKKLIEECTDIINDEIETLRTLAREFSDFARMPRVNPTPGNFNELVQDVSRIHPVDVIAMQLADDLPEFPFDHEKMRRVLINLIENGMDSIREKGGGTMSLKTEKDGDFMRFIYSDSGTGIAADFRDKIFEPYFSTKRSGVGLGLAIVKRIIDEHGGSITLESEEGIGTEFRVVLPLDMQEPDSTEPQPETQN